MTGIAALITAITGLVLAFNKIDRTNNASDTQNHVSRSPSEEVRQAPTPVGSKHSSRKVGPVQDPAVASNSDSEVEQASYSINLPAKREYVIGKDHVAGRYILETGNISPLTSEADILRIHVRLVSLAQDRYSTIFNSNSFSLVVDGKKIRPREDFYYLVYSQKTREEDVLFAIPSGLKRATFRIGNYVDGVDIPLDLSPAESVPNPETR